MDIEENKQEQKVVDISPITKGKRILVFLADFFINFIMCFVIFNATVMPIGNWVSNSTMRQKRNDEAARTQFDILYEQDILHYEASDEKYYYTKNVETTLNCYLSYYSFSETDHLDSHPQYGTDVKNEVLFHFYNDIRGKFDTYKATLERFNKEHDFFIIDGTNISLRADIKYNIRLSYFSEGDMSEDGKKALGYLQDFFINAFADVFTDIQKNDLVSSGKSYLANKAIVDDCERQLQNLLIIGAVIAYVISTAINYLLIPLINKDNKTIAMMMMRLVKIGTNNLYLLTKGESVMNFVYALAFNIPLLFFMPMTQVAFTYLFNIVPLTSLLFVGILFWLISVVVLLISPLGQSLTDFLSRSVIIKNEDLDEIYRTKGYDI